MVCPSVGSRSGGKLANSQEFWPKNLDDPGQKRENRLFESLGGVPERSKGADCKSVGSAFGGSNPPPSTTWLTGTVGVRRIRDFRLDGGLPTYKRTRAGVVQR